MVCVKIWFGCKQLEGRGPLHYRNKYLATTCYMCWKLQIQCNARTPQSSRTVYKELESSDKTNIDLFLAAKPRGAALHGAPCVT